MKLSELKTNDTFKTDSGTSWRKLAMTVLEKRKHKDSYKCQITDTGEIYYLPEKIMIIIKKCKLWDLI